MDTRNSDTNEVITHISEAIVTEILARLPFRSISRFKSVCKTWKSVIASAYFRHLFMSLQKNSSSSWSLMWGDRELIGFHGCDLKNSLVSYIPPNFIDTENLFRYSASSNGLVLIDGNYDCYVGNPVLQQWVQIPPPPCPSAAIGLATRVDEDGVVLGFIVVRFMGMIPRSDGVSTSLSLCVYNSETGVWSTKLLDCHVHINGFNPMFLNGTMYLSQARFFVTGRADLISHDFYAASSDDCLVMSLPDEFTHKQGFTVAILTTSREYVMYIKTIAQNVENMLKVWRLISDTGGRSWQLLWRVSLPFINSYVPMTMHPFDIDIVYLWSQQKHHLVSYNLRTQKYGILGDTCNDDDHQNFVIDQSKSKEYMGMVCGSGLYWSHWNLVKKPQFVLPRWMESLPRPPQVEMIDTNSLLSRKGHNKMITGK